MAFDDDASLRGGIELIRVIAHSNWCVIREDGSERPSSATFVESTNEASCFVLMETNLDALAAKFPGKKLAVITAAAARETGFIIARDEEGGDGIPGHVLLIQQRERPGSKQHVKLARLLANSARIIQAGAP